MNFVQERIFVDIIILLCDIAGMRILSATSIFALAFSASAAFAEPVENEIPLALKQAQGVEAQNEESFPTIPGYRWAKNTSDQNCLISTRFLPGAIDLFDTTSRPIEMSDVNGEWKRVVFCEEKFQTQEEYRTSLENPVDLVSSLDQPLPK